MNGAGARAPRRREESVGVQIAGAGRRRPYRLGGVGKGDMGRVGVGLGVDGDAPQAERATSADDAAGDLAAVGDQHRVEHGR